MSESPSENMESQSSDAAIEEAIHKLQVESWRKGEEGLQFRVCYLMLELATERDAPNQWKLNKRSIDIDLLDRAMRREEETILNLLENEGLLWNKLGINPVWQNGTEIQPSPFRYGDIIFICFSVPHWIKATERKKFTAKGALILKQYRKDNPTAMIIAVSDQPGFKLSKDPLFAQWSDIGKETSGVGKAGTITRMVAQQLTSQATMQSYLQETHTTHKLQSQLRQQQLQEHVDGLQALQTDFNLLVIIHPGLYDTHAKRIWNQLSSLHFRSVEVRQQNEVRPEQLRQFDFFVLVQCGFPEKFRQLREFQRIARRIYRFDGELPAKLPQIRSREFYIRNALEDKYLRIIEKVNKRKKDEKFLFLQDKYQEQWKLILDKNNNIQQINQLQLKLKQFAEGYYALIETVLMEATQQVHEGSRFGGVMKNLTRFLIVDDFNPAILDYLVKRRFARKNLNYMSSLEMFQHFNRFKAEHSQLKSAQSYQMFMRNDPLFANYEVVVINAWNFETNGSLEVKLRIAPPPEETADSPSIARDIVLGSRNLNQLLDTDRDELYQSLAAGNSKKSEQGQEVVFMLENLISNADLITSGRMMGVKKGRLYNLFQLEEEMKRLSESLRNEKFQEEEGVEEDSDAGVEAETEMVEESRVEEDSNWFMPIIRYQVDILYVIAMACSIRWQGLTENKKACQYIEEEGKRTGEGSAEILQRALVHAISHEKDIPEAGVLAAFPDMGGSRFVYGRVLPGRSEMLEPEFALYLIDMRHFQAREVIEFLRMRNRSPIAHVPVLLYVPPGVDLTREEDAMLGRLIGVRAGEEVNGLPVPYRIDDLENSERIKHLVQGILKIDDDMIQQGGFSAESDFLEDHETAGEDNIFSNW